MAKRSAKSKSRTKKGSASSSTPEEPAQTAAALNDDELQALAEQHKEFYESALATKKKADADFKNVCKRAKAELGKDAIDTIKTLIECDTPEGEARVIGRLRTTVMAARWAGVKIGTQFAMFAADEVGSRLFEEGKRSAMRGEPCKAPADASAEGQQDFIKGWHVGNDARNKNLADAVGREEDAGDGNPPRMSRADWRKHMQEMTDPAPIAEAARTLDQQRGIGTEPATHQTVA